MSRSNKSRYGMSTKRWKDSAEKSHSQADSRAEWKKLSSRSARRKSKQEEGRERGVRGNVKGRVPRDRLVGGKQPEEN